jgi:glycyl-tRNA synthetase beta chain
MCKNDLVTEIVDEFPELQGIMGGYYAQNDAIRNHYKPMGEGDITPTGNAALLSLADKVDSLVSLTAAGEKATGSGDPYALRRYALGIIRLLIDNNISLNIKDLVSLAYSVLNLDKAVGNDSYDDSNTISDVLNFIQERLKHYLRAQGYDPKLTNAIVDINANQDIRSLASNIKSMDGFLKTKEGADLLAAYKRASGILGESKPCDVDPGKFVVNEEKELFVAISALQKTGGVDRNDDNEFVAKLKGMATLLKSINNFFDNVMVEDKDISIATNRIGLLQMVVREFDMAARFDLSLL